MTVETTSTSSMKSTSNRGTEKTILIVDDDFEIVQSLTHALESRGYKVNHALDGNAGLAVVETKCPDLLILDIMMPKRSGFLVLERIRQSYQEPCPVIMITANEGRRHQQYAEMLGVNEYLHKPFTIDSLLNRVAELLDS
ncbi:response regulator transcription factor [Mariniblastus sp.]|nr:response regulator transcription factor [Mariniblastus sp.]